jgi:hypothetical protein
MEYEITVTLSFSIQWTEANYSIGESNCTKQEQSARVILTEFSLKDTIIMYKPSYQNKHHRKRAMRKGEIKKPSDVISGQADSFWHCKKAIGT